VHECGRVGNLAAKRRGNLRAGKQRVIKQTG